MRTRFCTVDVEGDLFPISHMRDGDGNVIPVSAIHLTRGRRIFFAVPIILPSEEGNRILDVLTIFTASRGGGTLPTHEHDPPSYVRISKTGEHFCPVLITADHIWTDPGFPSQ